MKIIIPENNNLPAGEYELTDRSKLERTKGSIGFGRSDELILLEYDRIAGRVTKDGFVLPPQSLWNIEQQHMNKPIEEFSDAELLAVIRKAENTNVPGSLFQRANNEWQIRQQQKILEATKSSKSGIFFEVGGDMTNHGVIQTAKDSIVDVAVAGNYSSNKNTKIIQGDLVLKEWYEKPFGILILTIVAGLIIAGLVFWLGWN